MKNVKKLILATAVMAFAFSGGILATNQVGANADPTVLAALVMDNSGMAIRTKNPEGLRFGATLEMNDEQMTAANIVGTGMILMPADKVDGALEYGETNADGTEALDIPTEVYYKETAPVADYYKGTGALYSTVLSKSVNRMKNEVAKDVIDYLRNK